MHLDIPALIGFLGYPGLALVVFAESGFLLGALLPGDSLLITAGLLASRDHLNIWLVVLLSVVSAIAGDSFGYWMGHRYGRGLFSREESFFFRKEYVTRTEEFYAKHGKKTLILARFMPVVRTLAPIFAGIGKMNYREFVLFNVIGGVLWGAGLTLAGYFFGSIFPEFDKYLTFIIIGIILASVSPLFYQYFSSWWKKSRNKLI